MVGWTMRRVLKVIRRLFVCLCMCDVLSSFDACLRLFAYFITGYLDFSALAVFSAASVFPALAASFSFSKASFASCSLPISSNTP